MTKLIERNTTIPVQKSETFSTAADNQTGVDIHILQGERPMAGDNMTLGHFRLEGIASAPRGLPQVEVVFDIDANGILNVTATDKATGKEQKITVTASTNLKAEDIDQLVKDAAKHQAEDEQRRILAQARNEADTLIYQAEKALSDLGENVPANDRNTIESQIDAVKKASQGSDVNSIQSTMQILQNATYALTQQMQAGNQAADGGGTGRQQETGEDVIEGDYTTL